MFRGSNSRRGTAPRKDQVASVPGQDEGRQGSGGDSGQRPGGPDDSSQPVAIRIIDAYVTLHSVLGLLDLAVREDIIVEKKRKAKKFFPQGALPVIDSKLKETFVILESVVKEIDRERVPQVLQPKS